ncbi:AbrB/MazE/SpoVT family DNA-binding domain-containing protein [archaeon]|nr:AbrB/MazE/SpoVT family DNA-binding domain-containing protein [archaeon]
MVIEISCKTKKWGSSIGIIIPKEIVDKENISIGEKIVVEIKSRPKAGDIFGDIPGWKWKRSTAEIIKEVKKGWD